MKNKIWYREGSIVTSPALFKFLASLLFAGALSALGFFGINQVGVFLILVFIASSYLCLERAWSLEDIETDINSELHKFNLTQSIRKNPVLNFDPVDGLISVQIGDTHYHTTEYEMYRCDFGANVYFTVIYVGNKHIGIVSEGKRSIIYETVEVQ